MNTNNQTKLDATPTIIDSDVEIHGKIVIKGEKNIVIKGFLKGEIESTGRVTVDVSGKVHGSIHTRELIVEGRIETDMDVAVSGVLTVRKGGILIASKISYGDLCHESGARMTGQLEPYESLEREVSLRSEKLGSNKPNQAQSYQKNNTSSDTPINTHLTPVTTFLGSNQHGQSSSAPKPVEGVTSLPFRSDLGAPKSLYTPDPLDEDLDGKDSSLLDIERA